MKSSQLGDAYQDSRRTSYAGKITQVHISYHIHNLHKIRNEKKLSLKLGKSPANKVHTLYSYRSYTAIFQCSGPPSKVEKTQEAYI